MKKLFLMAICCLQLALTIETFAAPPYDVFLKVPSIFRSFSHKFLEVWRFIPIFAIG
jgi:hypothetical protein